MAARLRVVDMHTAGEPVRIVVEGYPELKGDTLLAKRRYVRDHLDHIRRQLILEPRGHAWLIPGPEAHWAKLAFEKYFLATHKRGHV